MTVFAQRLLLTTPPSRAAAKSRLNRNQQRGANSHRVLRQARGPGTSRMNLPQSIQQIGPRDQCERLPTGKIPRKAWNVREVEAPEKKCSRCDAACRRNARP